MDTKFAPAQEKLVAEIVKAHEASQAELPWEAQTRTVTLTNAEWNSLTCYLILTTKHREGERDAWLDLSLERNEDGSPKFPNAAKNAEYWQEVIDDLDQIRAVIERAQY